MGSLIVMEAPRFTLVDVSSGNTEMFKYLRQEAEDYGLATLVLESAVEEVLAEQNFGIPPQPITDRLRMVVYCVNEGDEQMLDMFSIPVDAVHMADSSGGVWEIGVIESLPELEEKVVATIVKVGGWPWIGGCEVSLHKGDVIETHAVHVYFVCPEGVDLIIDNSCQGDALFAAYPERRFDRDFAEWCVIDLGSVAYA